MSVPEMGFDAFIAIDWSGATKNYNGISVAMCKPGKSAPHLVGAAWTRTAIADWLIEQLSGSQRLLIGLDFGFGLPYEEECGYLGGHAPGIDNIFDLWAHIDSMSCNDPDFGCASFVSHANHKNLFWSSGRKPKGWFARKRRTEFACAEATRTYPDTLYRLIGSKQVGKASLTGMRVLHHVRSRVGSRVAVWPFERVRHSALVEIYPTLFRRLVTGNVTKIRDAYELNHALVELDSKPTDDVGKFSDHDADALVSSVGLRLFGKDPKAWSHGAFKQSFREGWIFGVRG